MFIVHHGRHSSVFVAAVGELAGEGAIFCT